MFDLVRTLPTNIFVAFYNLVKHKDFISTSTNETEFICVQTGTECISALLCFDDVMVYFLS